MIKLIEKFKKLRTIDKIQFIAAVCLTMAFIVSLPVVAWFSHQKKIATLAKINSPATLEIRAGNAEDIINFRLSGIDVGDNPVDGKKYFVFCVQGEDISKYQLQFAHTTNIKFDYKLWKSFPDDNGEADYYSPQSPDFPTKYKLAEELIGDLINPTDDSGRYIGSNNYLDYSYNKDGDVRQKNAEPLYWQSESIEVNGSFNGTPYNRSTKDKETAFLNYYVLEVSWEGENVMNDNETDLIYITAKAES